MPTYEYRCSSCNKIFEVFHGMAENPVNKCPDCGSKVKRLITGGSGFIMKGGGGSMEMPSCAQAGSCCASGTCGMHGHGGDCGL
jgi:putative FmdB family regulatory protein